MRLTREQMRVFKKIDKDHRQRLADRRMSTEEREVLHRLDALFKLFSKPVHPATIKSLQRRRLIRRVMVTRSPNSWGWKPAGQNCRGCHGLGHLHFSDSFDRDNGKMCPMCKGLGRLFGRKRVSYADYV